MIKLLLVDDEPLVRKGLRMRLASEPDLVVGGEATNGKEALVLAEALHPDVVLMDIELPLMDGIAATQALHAFSPELAVIILTIHDDEATRAQAQAAGATAFITKSGANGELLRIIRQAVQERCTPNRSEKQSGQNST